MKTFRHILFNAVVVQSLVFGVATAVLWVRSFDVGDQVMVFHQTLENEFKGSDDFRIHTQIVALLSGRGGVELSFGTSDEFMGNPGVPKQSFWWHQYQADASPEYPGWIHPDFSSEWGGFGYGRNEAIGEENIAWSSSASQWVWFPLWFPLLLSLILPAIWLVRWRRARRSGRAA